MRNAVLVISLTTFAINLKVSYVSADRGYIPFKDATDQIADGSLRQRPDFVLKFTSSCAVLQVRSIIAMTYIYAQSRTCYHSYVPHSLLVFSDYD